MNIWYVYGVCFRGGLYIKKEQYARYIMDHFSITYTGFTVLPIQGVKNPRLKQFPGALWGKDKVTFPFSYFCSSSRSRGSQLGSFLQTLFVCPGPLRYASNTSEMFPLFWMWYEERRRSLSLLARGIVKHVSRLSSSLLYLCSKLHNASPFRKERTL